VGGALGSTNAQWNLGGSTLTLGNNSTNNSLTVAAGGILTNAAITLSGSDSVFNLSGDVYISKVNLSAGSAQMNFTGGGTLHATANGSLLYGAGTNTFSGSGGTIDTAGFTVTNSVVNTGDSGLTKLGEGTLVLSGTNTYTGGTVVEAGKLSLMQPTALSSASSLDVKSGASVDLNYTGTNTIYSLSVNGEFKTSGVYNAAAVGGSGEGYLLTVYPPPKGTLIRFL
jgi:fibronectin-binding autotransporter adhesin